MKYLSVKDFASKYGVSERTIRNYCVSGKIEGAFLTGKTWNIPEDANLPQKGKHSVKETPLVYALRFEKENKIKGGIYHKTQIELTYNSNHIEGSRLSHEQTRYIFETNTIGITEDVISVDDIIETVNHFKCIDYIIDCVNERLNEKIIKDLHRILKSGTQDSSQSWFSVGDYKKLPNEVGGNETTRPELVRQEMKELLKQYNSKKEKSLDDILDFHYHFEQIHPFQDGNGRVGRLIMFKECLANKIVPFVITDDLKYFYYRGLSQWEFVREYLRDTCLTAQDNYKKVLEYFKVNKTTRQQDNK